MCKVDKDGLTIGTRVYSDRKELHNRKKTPRRAPGQQIPLINLKITCYVHVLYPPSMAKAIN